VFVTFTPGIVTAYPDQFVLVSFAAAPARTPLT